MSDVIKPASKSTDDELQPYVTQTTDIDPVETNEWLDSLEYVLGSRGPERVKYLLTVLEAKARTEGVDLAIKSNTPYINTIPTEQQPQYPGNREIERRLKSIIRWNAMAMVVRANKMNEGIGGHISTYASCATLFEVAFNHFLRGRGESGFDGDLIYFPGACQPGNLCSRLAGRAAGRKRPGELSSRAPARGRFAVIPACMVDAEFLGVPHRIHGARADHGDLSSEV